MDPTKPKHIIKTLVANYSVSHEILFTLDTSVLTWFFQWKNHIFVRFQTILALKCSNDHKTKVYHISCIVQAKAQKRQLYIFSYLNLCSQPFIIIVLIAEVQKKSVSFVTRNYKTTSTKPKLKLDLDFYCTATDLFLLKHVLQKIFCQK